MAGPLQKPVPRAESDSGEPDRGPGPGPDWPVPEPGPKRPVPEPGPKRPVPEPGPKRPARLSPAPLVRQGQAGVEVRLARLNPAGRPAGRAGTTARPDARSPPPRARPPGPPPRPVPPRPRACSRPRHSIIMLCAHIAPHTIIPITTKRMIRPLRFNTFRRHHPTRKMSNRKNRRSPNCRAV